MKYLQPLAKQLKIKYAGKGKSVLVEAIHGALSDGRQHGIQFEDFDINTCSASGGGQGQKTSTSNQQAKKKKTVLETMFQAWFMSPFAGSGIVKEAFKMGSANEDNVFKGIPNFVRTYANEFGFFLVRMYTFGLVCRRNSPWLATSPDGFAVIMEKFNMFGSVDTSSPDSEPPPLVEESCAGALIEIKTVSTEDSIKHQEELAQKFGKVFHVNVEHPNFCKCITTIGYRLVHSNFYFIYW